MKRETQHILFDLKEDAYSFKGFGMLCWLYLGTLLIAAIFSPLLFNLAHNSVGFQNFANLLGDGTADYLKEKPITRYFDRIRLLSVVIVLPILFKQAKLYSFRAIGFRKPFSQFWKWYAIGLGMMVIVLAATIVSQSIEPKADWTLGRQIEKSASAVIGAFILSIMEEVIFRGLVFRLFYTVLKPLPAIVFSSLFFASLHFKMSPELIAHLIPGQIGIDDGFRVAWGNVTAVTEGFKLLSFINYALVGILLHQVFLRTGNLWSNIGLHAGWVTLMLSLNKTFQATENASAFTGTHRVIDGYWVTIVMVAFVATFALFARKNQP